MAISKHAEEFFGYRVEDFDPAKGIERPEDVVYRISLGYDSWNSGRRIEDQLGAFLSDPSVGRVPALVVGAWDYEMENDAAGIVAALVAAAPRMPSLRAIFLGDITFEETEISWIHQTDVSPLWDAFPQLEAFRVRGGEGLSLGRLAHENLRALAVETGGLPVSVVREVTSAKLPCLEHLELWLGSDGYGGDHSVADLEPILAGRLFPSLRYLGLRDSELADEVAAAVAASLVLERIETLDLSLGNLGDAGARALLASPAVRNLKRIDLHHHYVADELVAELAGLGVDVDASDKKGESDDEDRYIAVSE